MIRLLRSLYFKYLKRDCTCKFVKPQDIIDKFKIHGWRFEVNDTEIKYLTTDRIGDVRKAVQKNLMDISEEMLPPSNLASVIANVQIKCAWSELEKLDIKMKPLDLVVGENLSKVRQLIDKNSEDRFKKDLNEWKEKSENKGKLEAEFIANNFTDMLVKYLGRSNELFTIYDGFPITTKFGRMLTEKENPNIGLTACNVFFLLGRDCAKAREEMLAAGHNKKNLFEGMPDCRQRLADLETYKDGLVGLDKEIFDKHGIRKSSYDFYRTALTVYPFKLADQMNFIKTLYCELICKKNRRT